MDSTDQPKPAYQPNLGRKMLMLGVSLFALIFVWTFYFIANKRQAGKPPDAAASLAVLPFVSPDDSYIGRGLSMDVSDALSKVPGLRLIRSSPGQPHHADAVLEGTAVKSANQLKISVKLTDATTGFQLWSKTYERDLKDAAMVEEEIARAAVGSLRVDLKLEPTRQLLPWKTQNPTAYNFYLEGRATGEIRWFDQAIAADPDFAAAYSARGLAETSLGFMHPADGRQMFEKAKTDAAKAIQLDETSAEAHAVLGFCSAILAWDWTTSEREFQRALQLNPGSPVVHALYAAGYLTPKSQLDRASEAVKTAQSLDPLGFFAKYDVSSQSLVGAMDKDHAFSELDKALAAHDPRILWISVDPRLSQLRADAHYASVLDRMGLGRQ